MPMHEMHDVKTSRTLSWDVWLIWPSKIDTSTTFVWRQLWSWNKISRPQGTTPHPQHRWRPTSLQSWALTTSSSPLHLDQSKAEKHGNRWKSVEMKHIETHKGSFLRLLFHICVFFDFCEEFVVDQCLRYPERIWIHPERAETFYHQGTRRPRWNPHQHATKLHERWDGRFPQLSRTIAQEHLTPNKFFQLGY